MNYDEVNHPKHYINNKSGIECIEINENMNFCIGNAVKYIYRNEDKHSDPLLDIEKALWYIDRELSLRETKEKMERVTEKVAEFGYHSPKYMGESIFELWLATLDPSDKKHLKIAKNILHKELDRRIQDN